jgi:PAS domain S-box-containing protein
VRAFESELTRSDGSTVHVRTAARAFRTPDGVTQYIEGTVEDVTEERHAKDLHARAAPFMWVFDGSGLAILLLDLSGVVRDANPAFLRAFDFQASDVAGREMVDFVDEDDRAPLTNEISRIVAGADDVSASQLGIRAADGRVLRAYTRSGLVRTWDGHPDHIIVLVEDVTEA